MIRAFALVFAVAAAAAAVAAPQQSVSYLEFGKGPAQWIMTPAEQRAWRSVRTEDQARDFIDLFWARRDPTPGTPLNEFRTEFDTRVSFADQWFKEQKTRGSLTERGRVLVVLGFPREMNAEMSKAGGTPGNDIATVSVAADPRGGATDNAGSLTGGRALAARDVWTYTHEQAEKFSVPKIEVVFVHDMTGDRVRRDPSRLDFTSALPGAIRSYVVNPDLTAIPEWASSRVTKAPASAAAEFVSEMQTTKVTKRTVLEEPVVQAKPAGAGKLALLTDIGKLQPQSGVDPFASVQSVTTFSRDQELGWTAEYCAGVLSAQPPALKVQLTIEGKGTSGPVRLATEAEEFVPDSIKASPGCYLVRGSLPLADVEPGSYKLTVTISGTQEEQRYNLTREFRIE